MRLLATAALLITTFAAPTALAQEVAATPADDAKLIGYQFGFGFGMRLGREGFVPSDLTQDGVIKGFMAGLVAAEFPAEDRDRLQTVMDALQKRVGERMAASAKKNTAEAAAFIEKNKSKDGVQTTATGLQYRVIKTGSGDKPTEEKVVSVHYEGKLLDGTIFDSSIARNEPAEFQVTAVIPGWTEALLRMKVGDKWELYIPPALAYGPRGSLPRIGPNAMLIFQVELLEVK